MSQHSQRTQFGPSTAQIVMAGLSTAASSAGTAYVFTMPGFSVRELVACLMGATLAGLLAMHTLSLAADRAVARDRAERAAKRERRETSANHAELRSWQAAAAGLLDAYLSGRAVDFGGEPVPDYVRARLADVPPPEPTSPAYAGPYEDHAPLAPPTYPEPESRISQEVITGQAAQPPETWVDPMDALEYLPPREVPVSPGRGWHGDETEVISRVRDEDETEVIERVR